MFLSTAGAFDTEAAAFAPRLGYWLLIALLSTAALGSAHHVLRHRRPSAPGWKLRAAGVALLMLPLTAIATLGCKALFSGTASIAGFTLLLPGMAAILVALQAVLASFSQAFPNRLAPAAPSPTAAALTDCLPLPLRGARLIAIEAEDHYVRVHTSAGAALIRMRFGDAVAAVSSHQGLRPHRSWWVAADGVAGLRREGGRTTLTLTGAQRVPVSRAAARRLGPTFGV
ncbi:MAG: LytTR family transcriptional regulator [Pseudomonadota bacterium]|nr:LytTR family transcriptional regulator [Pseudomonadota bacterium]